MVGLVRFSSVAGAIVWLIGLPLVAFSGVIPSDTEYFSMGIVSAMLGLTTAPLAVAYSYSRPCLFSRTAQAVGAIACAGLLVTGILLVAGASGSLGERAPTWVVPAAELALAGLFLWVLLATYSIRDSKAQGRSAWALAGLAVASFLITLLLPWFDPSFVSTNATIPFELILFLLIWLCLPAWFIVVGLRMPRGGPGRHQPTQ